MFKCLRNKRPSTRKSRLKNYKTLDCVLYADRNTLITIDVVR